MPGHMSGSAIPPIERLLRGISTNHVETVRDAWRVLLDDGAASVPALLAKLDSDAWADNPRGPLARYLGVLLALLDEIDPAEFAREVQRLRTGELHAHHRHTVELMAARVKDAPVGRIGPGIPVYIARDVPDRDDGFGHLARWSRTEGLELDSLTRIDVITHQPELDYLGLYNLYFTGIILAWPAKAQRGIIGWLLRIEQEHTFYHEVGHHACGHVEGGSVEEQEDEANAYTAQMMRKTHPVLARIAPLARWIALALMRLVLGIVKRRAAGAPGTTG